MTLSLVFAVWKVESLSLAGLCYGAGMWLGAEQPDFVIRVQALKPAKDPGNFSLKVGNVLLDTPLYSTPQWLTGFSSRASGDGRRSPSLIFLSLTATCLARLTIAIPMLATVPELGVTNNVPSSCDILGNCSMNYSKLSLLRVEDTRKTRKNRSECVIRFGKLYWRNPPRHERQICLCWNDDVRGIHNQYITDIVTRFPVTVHRNI